MSDSNVSDTRVVKLLKRWLWRSLCPYNLKIAMMVTLMPLLACSVLLKNIDELSSHEELGEIRGL